MKNGKWGEVILKKIFLIIISTILISLIGLGVIGYYVEKDEAAQAQKNKTEGTIVKEEDKEESKFKKLMKSLFEWLLANKTRRKFKC